MKYMYKLILIVLCTFSSAKIMAQTAHSFLREGDEAYEKANYATAEEDYRKASETKTSFKSDFNLGNTLYKQDRFEEATQYYQSAISKISDEELKAEAYHNLGNSLFNEQKLKESIDAYKEALRIAPKDMETKYNLQKTKQLLKMQQQQQDQQKQDQQQQDQQQDQEEQKDQEDNQDQEKQDQDNKEDQKDQKNEENSSDEKSENDQKESTNTGEEDKQTIDREDALKLLKVIENEEKKVQEKLHRIKSGSKQPEKDW